MIEGYQIFGLDLQKTEHYKTEHERDVPWSQVIRVIFTTKKRQVSKDLFEFKSDTFYVLCKRDGEKLKVINAKRIK